MGDAPPSEDEIKRQNKCLKQCGDEFLTSEQVWVQLFNDGKIPAERALGEFKKCKKVFEECCDQCVPRLRRFTDEQKGRHERSEGVLITFAVLGAVAGTSAAVFGLLGVGVLILAVSAGLGVVAIREGILTSDPIDPDFSEVPVPSFPKLVAIRPVRNTGLTASVARAANAVIANQAKAIGLLNALLTALDRSDGAADAGDISAEEQQLNAARDFAKKLADVLSDAASLRLALASKWTGRDLDFTISEQDALKLRDDIIINGFPRQFLDALKKFGVDQKDQDALRQSLIIKLANLSGFHQIRFRDLLIDPNLRAAEVELISSLEQFSRSR